MKQTQDFIAALAADNAPIDKQLTVATRMTLYLGFTFLAVFIWVNLSPEKVKMWAQMPRDLFVLQVAWLTATGFVALIALFGSTLAAPDKLRQRSYKLSVLALVSASSIVVWQLARLAHRLYVGIPLEWTYSSSTVCAVSVFTASIVFGGLALYLVRKYGSLSPLTSSLLAGICGASAGVVGRAFICPLSDPAQLLSYHFTPAIVTIVILSLVGQKALKW